MNISKISDCTNCGSCINSCPNNAITLEEKDLFYYPVVNNDKCVDCSLCYKHCPTVTPSEKSDVLSAYAGWANDNEVVLKSSSGGFFYGIACKVLEESGVVFGASFSDDYRSVGFSYTDKSELCDLQKSKYVESTVGESFREINVFLNQKRKVLFCGTPCQVAGLKAYLNCDNENLITVDFACGGLPSHKIYSDYIDYLEKKFSSKVKCVDFRPKTHGWERHAMLVEFENGIKYNRLGTEDEYLRSFLYGKKTVRVNCLNCIFSDNHKSDITLADFWLYKKYTELKNDDGISLVLCNTEKGRAVVEALSDKYTLEKLDVSKAVYNNKKTVSSEEKINANKKFVDECLKNGITASCNKFYPQSLTEKAKNTCKRFIYRRKTSK